MFTRRAVLTGTAAASIGAIASAHGVEAAELGSQDGLGGGFGDLVGGALAAFEAPFDKMTPSFHAFLKFNATAADVFFKEQAGSVEVFFKTFFKGWTPVSSIFLKIVPSLGGAEASFTKLTPNAAEFFIKGAAGFGVVTTFQSGEGGIQVNVSEISP